MIGIYLAMIPLEEDKRYFEYLYYTYRDDMRTAIEYEMKYSADVEDALHDALISVSRRAFKLSFDTKEKERAYMITAAKNAARMLMRKQRRLVQFEPSDTPDIEDNSVDEFVDREYKKEKFNSVVAAINNLNDTYKEVLTLRYLLHMTDREIAAQLNRKVSTVRSQLSRGRKLIKETIGENDD